VRRARLRPTVTDLPTRARSHEQPRCPGRDLPRQRNVPLRRGDLLVELQSAPRGAIAPISPGKTCPTQPEGRSRRSPYPLTPRTRAAAVAAATRSSAATPPTPNLPLIVLAFILLLFWLAAPPPFESEISRIEHEVRKARREVERLEAEASRAMHDEVARRRLGRRG
jgi:hypothetical protein